MRRPPCWPWRWNVGRTRTNGLVAPANLLCLEACACAGAGNAERTHALVNAAYDEARRALGEDGLPDLLLPAAILAWRRRDLDRAQRWVTAIRRAGRPTANFLVTIMFRQLRDRVGYQQADPLEHSSLTELIEECRLWLSSVAAGHD